MAAHFIAPNTSPFIRYAIYFRVKAPRFGPGQHNRRSMLEPWVHWDCMGAAGGDAPKAAATSGGGGGGGGGGGAGGGAAAAATTTRTGVELNDHAEAQQLAARIDHYASVDNLAVQEQALRRQQQSGK